MSIHTEYISCKNGFMISSVPKGPGQADLRGGLPMRAGPDGILLAAGRRYFTGGWLICMAKPGGFPWQTEPK
jgi:hypothetical protein